MIIQLPLENWADLLPFVPRLQLVQLLFQLDDRQFAKVLQFFLTKVGQITLDHLRIVAPREHDPNGGGGPIVEVRKRFWPAWEARPQSDLETNLPEGPMPTNLKNFKIIELSYFAESVANFLHHFQREEQLGNSLLDNVNLWFSSYLSPLDRNTFMPFLVQLMPMIGNININSMSIYEEMNFSKFPWCDWLYAPRIDGKPRVLRLFSVSFPAIKKLIKRIKKDFSKTKRTRPVSFFVHVQAYGRGNVYWQDACLDNGQTNERLVVKTIDLPHMDYPRKRVLISRYPAGANQGWIDANEQEIMNWDFDEQSRQIRLDDWSLRNRGNV